MKLCKDCRHCIPLPQKYLLLWFVPYLSEEERYTYSKCDLAFVAQKQSLTTGRMEPTTPLQKYASLVREFGPCGTDGRMFEPKEQKNG